MSSVSIGFDCRVSVLEAFDPLMNNDLYNDKGKYGAAASKWF